MEYGTGFNAAYYQPKVSPWAVREGPRPFAPNKFVLLGIVSIATPVDEVNKSPIAFET